MKTPIWHSRLAGCAALCFCLALTTSRLDAREPPRKKQAVPKRASCDFYLLGPKMVDTKSSVSYRVLAHWASAPDIYGPLARATLALSLYRKNGSRTSGPQKRFVATLAKTRTDKQGEASVRFSLPELTPGDYTLRAVLRSRLGKKTRALDITVVPGAHISIASDKPLYRPGQPIKVRALVVRGLNRHPIKALPIRFRLFDARDNLLDEITKTTSRFGIAHTSFPLASGALLGDYRVVALAPKTGSATHHVKIRRYQLPRFGVRVTTDRKHYKPGQHLRATITARYVHGKPVVGGLARITVTQWYCPRAKVDCRRRTLVLSRTTDEKGKAQLALHLDPKTRLAIEKGRVEIDTSIETETGFRASTQRVIPISQSAIDAALLVPEDRLLSGVRNELHVLAKSAIGKAAEKRARPTLGRGRGGR
jgi:hypothetical protein